MHPNDIFTTFTTKINIATKTRNDLLLISLNAKSRTPVELQLFH